MRYIVERQESLLKGKQQPTAFQPFVEEFQSRIPAILQRLKKRLETHVESGEKVWPSITYNLSGKSEYAGLLARVNALL
jgi:hypothetical protein